ncbi:MAG: acyl carrier protein [Eubacteriales bacterium]|nr:acyl carrier protein [Eubacteriales bacterium]
MELEKLKEIIAEVLHVDAGSITEDTSFVDDLGADSLDIFQIIMGIEEIYDIEIDHETVDGIQTVKGAVEAIRRITG